MRTKLIKCNPFVFVIIVLLLIIFITTFVLGSTEPKKVYTTYYKTIEIKKGDTLWTIAQSYNSSHSDVRNYILEIQNFNNMTHDTLIMGQSIVIPMHHK